MHKNAAMWAPDDAERLNCLHNVVLAATKVRGNQQTVAAAKTNNVLGAAIHSHKHDSENHRDQAAVFLITCEQTPHRSSQMKCIV